MTATLTFTFDPSEPRDDHGRWSDGGGGGDSPATNASRDLAASYRGAGSGKVDMSEVEGDLPRSVTGPMQARLEELVGRYGGGEPVRVAWTDATHAYGSKGRNKDGVDTIYLSKPLWTDPAFRDNHEKEFAGLMVDPSNAEGVATHEFGHILAWRALQADSEAYNATLGPLTHGTGADVTLPDGTVHKDEGYQSSFLMPSAYATESPGEAEAEMFTAVVSGHTAMPDGHAWNGLMMDRSHAYVNALTKILGTAK